MPDRHMLVTQAYTSQSTPPAVLARLARDRDATVLDAAAANPHTSPATLTRLAQNPMRWTLGGAASHPNTVPSPIDGCSVGGTHNTLTQIRVPPHDLHRQLQAVGLRDF